MKIEEEVKNIIEPFFESIPPNLSNALGIEFEHLGKKIVSATMPVDENTMQPFGILHGGASVALAETVASIGAWLNVAENNKNAVGIEINANHLRSCTKGDIVTAEARPVKRGRTIHVWEIKIRNQHDKMICISRCTLAIVDKR
ncbi:MAG TPA: PaaI family thioesterase [Balneolaceae bacterium]|nr:PaaI family thioesterase [Balneolaceae bacterium]